MTSLHEVPSLQPISQKHFIEALRGLIESDYSANMTALEIAATIDGERRWVPIGNP